MEPNPRYALATARILLRQAEDNEATVKAIVLAAVVASNDYARKHAGQVALYHSDDYQDTLRELRAAEAALDHAQAAVDIANDELRRAELTARERLAEALMGKRTDEAVVDVNVVDRVWSQF